MCVSITNDSNEEYKVNKRCMFIDTHFPVKFFFFHPIYMRHKNQVKSVKKKKKDFVGDDDDDGKK